MKETILTRYGLTDKHELNVIKQNIPRTYSALKILKYSGYSFPYVIYYLTGSSDIFSSASLRVQLVLNNINEVGGT